MLKLGAGLKFDYLKGFVVQEVFSLSFGVLEYLALMPLLIWCKDACWCWWGGPRTGAGRGVVEHVTS